MQVALLANTAWLDEELTTLQAMLIGLLDEGVRSVQVVPDVLGRNDLRMVSQRVTWQQSRWGILNRRRLATLATTLNELGVDLIHILDGRLWRAGQELAQAMDAPVIYQANCEMDLKLVEPLVRHANAARLAFAATTQPLVDAIQAVTGEEVEVALIPPGVHGKGERPRGRDVDQALCAIVSGNGRIDAHYHALLDGLALFTQEHLQTQIFFDGQSDNQHHLWRAANRLGLGANISLVPRRLGHRELLLRADLLIHPQPLGKSRSITLQAMAHGLPVLAHEDPWLDYLIDGQTAWVIHEPTPKTYYDQLTRISAHPEHGRSLGDSAQAWIRQGYLASDLVDRTVAFYRTITGQAIEFPG